MRYALAVCMAVVAAGGCDSGSSKVRHTIGDRVRLTAETWACDRGARDETGRQHDRDAFRSLMLRFASQGRCRALQPGAVLDVIEVALVDGGTMVRVKGQPDDWWVTSGVIAETAEKIGTWRGAGG